MGTSKFSLSVIVQGMRRIVFELLRSQVYRSSSDCIEQVGGLEHNPRQKQKTTRLYNDEQIEKALDLLSINALADLGRADFRVFNKKQS